MKKVNEKEFEFMSTLFQMFSDRTRLKILYQLFNKECCVNELVESLGISQSAVSHQLASLKKTRIVRSYKSGRNVFYCLDDDHIERIFQLALDHVKE